MSWTMVLFTGCLLSSSLQAGPVELASPVTVAEGGSLSTAAGDFDQDGRDEFVDVVMREAFRLFDWQEDSNQFDLIDLLPPEEMAKRQNRFGAGLAVADLNDDGWLDLVVPESSFVSGPGKVLGFLNPKGKLKEPWEIITIAEWPPGVGTVQQITDVAVGDVDQNGKSDVVVRDLEKGCHVILRNTAGEWQSPVLVEVNPSYGLGLADLDGDGDLDLALNGVWIETPEDPASASGWMPRIFAESWYPEERNFATVKQYSTIVQVADYNGDDRLDIAIANADQLAPAPSKPAGIQLFIAPEDPKSGDWKTVILETDHRSWSTFLQADFNQDNFPDLFSATSDYGIEKNAPAKMIGYFSYENGQYLNRRVLPISVKIYHASFGDVDGDGDLDLIAPTKWNGGELLFFENQPTPDDPDAPTPTVLR